MALRGFGSPSTVERVIRDSAAMLLWEEAMRSAAGAEWSGWGAVEWVGHLLTC